MNKTESEKKTILIVEDEVLLAMNQQTMLENLGYAVVTASNGPSAVSLFEKEETINLVLMDIDLGSGMDGTQCAEQILKKKEVPIIFHSSHSEPEIVERTEKITSYGYLVKGSRITVIDASIKMAFRLFAEQQRRKKSEEQLAANQQMLRKIIDTINYSIFWKDVNGKYLGCNKVFSQTANLKNPDEIIGKTDFDLPWSKEEAEAYRQDDEIVVQSNTSKVHIIEPLHGIDGKRYIIDTSKHPLIDETGIPFGVLGIFEDITDKRATLKELEKKEKMIANLATQVPGMMYQFLMKPDGSFSVPFSSNGVIDIFGSTPGEVKDDFTSIFEAIHPEDRELVMETIQESIRTLDQWKCEYRVSIPGKEVKWIYGNSIPEKRKDGSIIWSGYNVDITQQKKSQEAVNRQLQEKEILLKEVHHRIKNNIAAIIGLLSLHANTSDNPEVHNVLQDAVSRVNSMKLLYDKLLMDDHYEGISSQRYISDLLDSIQQLYPDAIRFTLSLDIDDFPLQSRNVFPLGLIINEIVTNIIKYAYPPPRTGEVSITFHQTDQEKILTIKDDGVGLPEGYKVESSHGFGHILVNMLAEQMGGNMHIISTRSGGTVHTLSFLTKE